MCASVPALRRMHRRRNYASARRRLKDPCTLPSSAASYDRFVSQWNESNAEVIMAKIQIVFYSMYGHLYQMARAVEQGVKDVPGCDVALYQVAELVPPDVLERVGAAKARAAFAHVPIAIPERLADADAIIFGTPTRFGM